MQCTQINWLIAFKYSLGTKRYFSKHFFVIFLCQISLGLAGFFLIDHSLICQFLAWFRMSQNLCKCWLNIWSVPQRFTSPMPKAARIYVSFFWIISTAAMTWHRGQSSFERSLTNMTVKIFIVFLKIFLHFTYVFAN